MPKLFSKYIPVSNTFYSRHKEILLKLSSVFLVLLVFVVIEVLVRLIFPGNPSDDMIDIGPINLFSKEIIQGETWYKISNKNAYSDRNILFKKEKEKDQIRIICLGGSASASWPHPPGEIYNSYLEKSLQKIYPSKKLEIINCSAHGFASYRIRQVFETIIPLQPDAVIIWCGNNEFLERRNYKRSDLRNSLIKLRNHSRSLQLVRQLFTKNKYTDTPDVADTFWKKVNEEALELRSDPEQLEKVKEHYQKSMEDIVEDASKNNIILMLMTVPVNLRDWEPNVSFLGLNSTDSLAWAKEFKEGKRQLLGSKYSEAIVSLGRAQKIAPHHAETSYWLAKAYENIVDTTAALQYYIQAKDLDYNPFRVISDFNNTLRTIAKNNPQVVLLDMEQLIRPYTHNGIPGFDLFLDYVHPTKTGNLVIACEAANKIISSNIISIPPLSQNIGFNEITEINKSEYQEEFDDYLQFTRFSLCCMTHQYNSALYFGKILIGNIPPELSNTTNSEKINLLNDAVATFQKYVDFEQKSLTREPTAEEEKNVMKDINLFYRKHFPYEAF
jgi:tetratricopeptide (TPR) repeat protein